MRILLIVFSVLNFSSLFAQPGGGGGGQMGGQRGGGGMQGGQQRERPEMLEFNAAEVAGIFNYDASEAIKKIKIKNKDLQQNVKKAIVNYNNKINDIALLNKDNFDTLNVYVNNLMKSRSKNRGQNRESSDNARGKDSDRSNDRELINQKTNPARIGVLTAEKKLNTELEALLDEKQYDKWLKYQKKIKDDLNPKQNENQNRSSGGRGSGGGQGGASRGGGMGGF